MKKPKKARGRQRQIGVRGNPSGKPRSARNRSTHLLENLMADDAAEIIATVLAAARLILDRMATAPRDRRLSIDLPGMDTAAGIAQAQAAILAAVADGQLRPAEAAVIADLVEMRRRSKPTEQQWAEAERRVLGGESWRAVADGYGISETALRKRISPQVEQIKTVANQLVATEIALESLPISSQINAVNMATKLLELGQTWLMQPQRTVCPASRTPWFSQAVDTVLSVGDPAP